MATGAQAQRGTCNDKLRLAREYEAYTAQYSRAVKTLRERMGVLSKGGYDELLRTTELARKRTEEARLALDRHVGEHGC